jgi:hypothetical protein
MDGRGNILGWHEKVNKALNECMFSYVSPRKPTEDSFLQISCGSGPV